jgi:hypothetical protein
VGQPTTTVTQETMQMTVTRQDLLDLGLAQGPQFDAALAEANRLRLTGAALQTFVRALGADQATKTPDFITSEG